MTVTRETEPERGPGRLQNRLKCDAMFPDLSHPSRPSFLGFSLPLFLSHGTVLHSGVVG